jgi:hypothetical protein
MAYDENMHLALLEGGGHLPNSERTCEPSGTGLTQGCSPAVPMNFDVEDARRKLTAMRKKLGADMPAGHRCSNLIEQLQNLRNAEGEQRANLEKSIKLQMTELAS